LEEDWLKMMKIGGRLAADDEEDSSVGLLQGVF
jgi:hypothetical protein